MSYVKTKGLVEKDLISNIPVKMKTLALTV